jgi:polar amino acid transport system permease protein
MTAMLQRRRAAHTVTGVVLMALWAAVGIGGLILLVMTLTGGNLATYAPRIGRGFLITVWLVVASALIGAVLSVPVAAGRLSGNPVAGALAYAYSYFFRGTPLLAQIFLIYYGAGQFAPQLKAWGLWWFFQDAFRCAILSFSLNTAAYQAEILAGALRALPRGQREAGAALGLHGWQVLVKIMLPQALVSALRPYGNEIILLIKASALASTITVLDLMGQTRFAFARTFDFSFYLWAAVLYLLMVEGLTSVVHTLEKRLTRHIRSPAMHR